MPLEPRWRRYLSFRRRNVATADLLDNLWQDLLAAAPDVESVALTTGGPMLGYAMIGLTFADGTPVPRLDNRDPALIESTANYLATTGLRLVRGRFFTDADRGQPVVVINQTAANAYWPGRDPIGRCLVFVRFNEPCATVIGVVQNGRLWDLVEPPTAQLFTPLGSGAPVGAARYLIARARAGRAEGVAALVRHELQRVFPDRGVPEVFTASDRLAPQLRPWRLGLTLFSAFGILALVVAAFGTYSVISYAVSQRNHEMSVRLALGARAADLVRLVLAESIQVAALGILLGLTASMLAAGVIQSLLYDTQARDPLVSVSVAGVLALMAVGASLIPARRAARTDPVVALRAE